MRVQLRKTLLGVSKHADSGLLFPAVDPIIDSAIDSAINTAVNPAIDYRLCIIRVIRIQAPVNICHASR